MLPVILAAGLGRRLGGQPKALYALSGTPLIARAVRMLAAEGHERVAVITGHGAGEVEEWYRGAGLPLEPTFVFNEHYADLNNFHTVTVACEELDAGPLLILNSDIVFLADVATNAANAGGDLVLAVEEAPTDDEAMKVSVSDDGHVTGLGKHLDPAASFGEFIGVSVLNDRGREVYVRTAREALDAGETTIYYEDIYSRICLEVDSRMSAVPQPAWAEIDAPEDVPRAEQVAALQDAA